MLRFLVACMILAFSLFVGMWLLYLLFAIVAVVATGIWNALGWLWHRLTKGGAQ